MKSESRRRPRETAQKREREAESRRRMLNPSPLERIEDSIAYLLKNAPREEAWLIANIQAQGFHPDAIQEVLHTFALSDRVFIPSMGKVGIVRIRWPGGAIGWAMLA